MRIIFADFVWIFSNLHGNNCALWLWKKYVLLYAGGECIWREWWRWWFRCMDGPVQRDLLGTRRRCPVQTSWHQRLPQCDRRAVRPSDQGSTWSPRNALSQSKQLLESDGRGFHSSQYWIFTSRWALMTQKALYSQPIKTVPPFPLSVLVSFVNVLSNLSLFLFPVYLPLFIYIYVCNKKKITIQSNVENKNYTWTFFLVGKEWHYIFISLCI